MGWGVSPTSRPPLPPGKDSVPIVQEAEWGPRTGLEGRKISSSPGFDPGPSSLYSVTIPTELPGPFMLQYTEETLSQRHRLQKNSHIGWSSWPWQLDTKDEVYTISREVRMKRNCTMQSPVTTKIPITLEGKPDCNICYIILLRCFD